MKNPLIKEYEKQIKSDNVGGGSAAVAAVEKNSKRLRILYSYY